MYSFVFCQYVSVMFVYLRYCKGSYLMETRALSQNVPNFPAPLCLTNAAKLKFRETFAALNSSFNVRNVNPVSTYIYLPMFNDIQLREFLDNSICVELPSLTFIATL